jgi:hypothetical protein
MLQVGVTEEKEDDVVQTGSAAHPASYPMGTGGSFSRDKAAEVKKMWVYTANSPYAFMA